MQKHDFLSKDMKKMMFKLRILRMIGKRKSYSYAIIKEFAKNKRAARFFNNKEDIKNEVYNTINALEKSGYIIQSGKSNSARAKNYYKITAKGKSALAEAKKVFISSLKEVSKIFR